MRLVLCVRSYQRVGSVSGMSADALADALADASVGSDSLPLPIFACVAFKEIYYLRAKIHGKFHNSKALPPYTEYLTAK